VTSFDGSQYKGAKRDLRKTKREEAEARNVLTPPERRSQKRATA